jgi:hypothetical protein
LGLRAGLFDVGAVKRANPGFTDCDELAQNMVGTGQSRFPQGHQNQSGEKHAKGLEAGIDLAERHAQQGGCKGGRSDQQRHGTSPEFGSVVKNGM